MEAHVAALGEEFERMDEGELREHCVETCGKIDEVKEAQVGLKKNQETVVDHLVETNEWVFAALKEVLAVDE